MKWRANEKRKKRCVCIENALYFTFKFNLVIYLTTAINHMLCIVIELALLTIHCLCMILFSPFSVIPLGGFVAWAFSFLIHVWHAPCVCLSSTYCVNVINLGIYWLDDQDACFSDTLKMMISLLACICSLVFFCDF